MKKILILSGLLVVLSLTACGGTGDSDLDGIDVGKADKEVHRVMGALDPKVKIVEYSDYECPFCAKFHEEAFKQIKEKYIDTNIVSFEFRDFPLGFHSYAKSASKAAHCAGDQGKYFEFGAMVYARGEVQDEKFVAYAEELELDTALFEACWKSTKYNRAINDNMALGMEAGVEGTPAIFINDQLVSGAQPFENFEKVIEEQLAL